MHHSEQSKDLTHEERLVTLLPLQSERTSKRLKTLEEDKMRLWKTQNEQQDQINALNLYTRELADRQRFMEDISIQRDITSQEAQQNKLNRLHTQLKTLRRQLALTMLLAILLAIWQVDWSALFKTLQHLGFPVIL